MEKNERGFFERIKETFFGEEKKEESKEEYVEEQDEVILDEISKEGATGTIQKTVEKEKTEESEKIRPKNSLQKISKEEIDAKEENKPIIEVLKTIEDPELGIDIWTLGLIYNIEIKKEEKKVHVLMTFTSIMCPVGPMIVQSVEQKVKQLPDVETVAIEVVFNPPWEPTEELREMLGV